MNAKIISIGKTFNEVRIYHARRNPAYFFKVLLPKESIDSSQESSIKGSKPNLIISDEFKE